MTSPPPVETTPGSAVPPFVRAPTDAERAEIDRYYEAAVAADTAYQWELAETLVRRFLDIEIATFGPEHPESAGSLDWLGAILTRRQHFADAEAFLRRGLAIREKALGAEHPETVLSLRHLAHLERARGRSEEAERLFLQVLAIREKTLGAEHSDTALGLGELAMFYQDRARYSDSEILYRRTVAILEKTVGVEHPDTAAALNNLGSLHLALARYQESGSLFLRALAIQEKALGPEHPTTIITLNNLAQSLQVQGRHTDAKAVLDRVLAAMEKTFGPEHSLTATGVDNLAAFHHARGRYLEAEVLHRRALDIRERVSGPEHPETAVSLSNLAALATRQGRYDEAERHFRRALAIWSKAGLLEDPSTAVALNNIGLVYLNQGADPKAEDLLRRALAIREKTLGAEHPATANSLNNLGAFYFGQGRYDEAEPLFRRALVNQAKSLGPDHPEIAVTHHNLGQVHEALGRIVEAAQFFVRASEIREKTFGPEHPETAGTLSRLAYLYDAAGLQGDAEPIHRRVLAIRERSLGPEHPDTADSLNALAEHLRYHGKPAEAEPLYRRAMEINRKTFGPDHWLTGLGLAFLARVEYDQKDWMAAVDLFEQSAALHIRMEERSREFAARTGNDRARHEIRKNLFTSARAIDAAYRIAEADPERLAGLMGRSYTIAQWRQRSETAAALSRMADRFAKGNDDFARLVREQQDLTRRYQALDKALIAAVAQPSSERNPADEEHLRKQMIDIDRRVSRINVRLRQDTPGYAAVTMPEPLSIEETRRHLRANEALFHLIADENGTFAWIVTRDTARWRKLDFTGSQLADHVDTLRCGLDENAWDGIADAARCGAKLQTARPAPSVPLPFHLGIAHRLYEGLFSPFEDLIGGKHLLIVASGALTSLPFQVLVTEPPEVDLPKSHDGYRNVPWLGRRQPITILPSVSGLKALRSIPRAIRAPEAWLGFGNPSLEGDGSCGSSSASGSTTCAATTVVAMRGDRPETRRRSRRSGARSPVKLDRVFRRGHSALAVAQEVRLLCPLPDTVQELACAATSLGAPESEIRLGETATETNLKQMSESGALGRFRVLHFATHGLVAGDLELMGKRRGEPALVLTPPETPKDEDDDGLLTASEVAQLKLNAEWVVLSACNTAAGDKAGAEALSGLTRAFLYAGARSLLVSHWPVWSDAAVLLTTRAFEELEREPAIGQAEALRRAIVALMDNPAREDNAHPSVWAPFVLVGEGA